MNQHSNQAHPPSGEANRAELPNSEAECRAIIKRLAEMSCGACKGSGTRFPWLRVSCRECYGVGSYQPPGATKYLACEACAGTTWVPNYGIQLEDAVKHLNPVEVRIYPRQLIYYVRLERNQCDAGGEAPTLELAFWRAVDKAVGHV